MRCGILVQARMSSSRLPGKMLMPLSGIPLAVWVLRRCAMTQHAGITALVTSQHPTDDALADAATRAGFFCFRGPLDDVRQRYILAARHLQLDVVGRVCGDSPFVDVDMLDSLLHSACAGQADYLRVTDTLPGFVSEVFTLQALQKSQSLDAAAVEHVTTTLRQHPELFTHVLKPGLPVPDGLPPLTVDTAQDMRTVQRLVEAGCHGALSAQGVLSCLFATLEEGSGSPV